MDRFPLVSVVIPNYNHARYLDERIKSVVYQSYPNIEVIILDDSSTDNSREIIEHFRNNPKIKNVLFNSENSGSPFKQWNLGVSIAKGEYIWIAESDDIADENFIESCIEIFESGDNDIKLVYTDSYEIDVDNNKLGRWSRWMSFLNTNLWVNDFCVGGQHLNKVYNHFINVIPNASCVVFRKSAYPPSTYLAEIEKLKFTGDWRIWFYIFTDSRVSYINKPLNYFRYHLNTTRSNPSKRLENVKEQYETIYKLKQAIEPSPDIYLYEQKLHELYGMWNPAIRYFFTKQNVEILYLALIVDKKLIRRLFQTFINRFKSLLWCQKCL
ncbi:glycosyltransferase family 2 protein [Mucilaginibacter pallidiroseus]|uniref:glycosyltransferase family 2 protein n=1 Tax=Mucilaginibacter pallidiroseus TaxID=2599295 RepID=UPI00164789E6|nr:glycosyltransferase family 2 protein [Mucilaginibacter pallidiroseus]